MNYKQLKKKNLDRPLKLWPRPHINLNYAEIGYTYDGEMNDYNWYVEKIEKRHITIFCGSTGHIKRVPKTYFRNYDEPATLKLRKTIRFCE